MDDSESRLKNLMRPVPPMGITIEFHYQCSKCGTIYSIPEPREPINVRCMKCGNRFPIVPVDECTINFIHLITNEGKAAADPDFA